VCREPKYNVLYRWFCDFGWDDIVPDDTTFVVFRKRLGEDKFRELFERIVAEAKAKDCVRGHWTIIDGTKVIAYVAVKNTLSRVNIHPKKKPDPRFQQDVRAFEKRKRLIRLW